MKWQAAMRMCLILGLTLAAAPALPADPDGAATIAGVSLPGRIEVEKQNLVLNGAALRKIALIKIYVAGLYLPQKESRPDAILTSDEPRSLVMHFLKEVDAKRLCEGWDSSLSENTPNPSSELMQQFEVLCGWMEDARDNERLAFKYAPGQGTTVEVHGKIKGPMAGKEFADALFRTWLGPRALPGEEFKQALLGVR